MEMNSIKRTVFIFPPVVLCLEGFGDCLSRHFERRPKKPKTRPPHVRKTEILRKCNDLSVFVEV